MPTFTSPSGREYQWNKETPPTQADIDSIIAYDNQINQQEAAGARSVLEKQNAQIQAPSEKPQTISQFVGDIYTSIRESQPVTALLGPTESQEIRRRALAGNVDLRSDIEKSGLAPATANVTKEILTSSPLPPLQIPQQQTVPGQIAAGTAQAVYDITRGLASPAGALLGGVGTLGAGAITPEVAQRLIAAGYSVPVAKQVFETATTPGTVQQKTAQTIESLVGAAGTVAPFLPRGTAPSAAAAVAETPTARIAEEAVAASKALESQLGIPAPLTAAQQTGAPGLAQFEAFTRRTGQGLTAKPIGIEKQQMAVADAVQKFVESAAPETPADVGATILRELSQGERKTIEAARQAAAAGAKEAGVAVESKVRGFTGLDPKELSTVGQEIRDSIQSKLEMDKNYLSSQFTEVNDLARQSAKPMIAGEPTEAGRVSYLIGERPTNIPFVSIDPVRNTISKIISSTPKTVEGEVSAPFLKSYSTLMEIQDLPNMTIDQAVRAKSVLGEIIGRLEGGAAEQIGGGFLLGDAKRLYKSFTESINNSIEKVSSSELRDRYKGLVKFAKENIEDVEASPVLRKIINQPDKGGFQNTSEIINYFAGGEGKLNDLLALKKIASPARYNQVRRGILDSLRGNSILDTAQGNIIDLASFSKQFSELSPEFKRELVGSDAGVNALQSALKQAEVAGKVTRTVGRTTVASEADLATLIDEISSAMQYNYKPTAAVDQFVKAMAKETDRRKIYYNDITKKISESKLGEVPIDPARIVDDVFLVAERPEVVMKAMSQLSPETRRQVQNVAAKTLLQKVTDLSGQTLSDIVKGKTDLKSEQLVNLFVQDPKRREILNILIPDDIKPVITDFVKYRRGIDQAYKMGGQQGLVAAQETFGGALGKGSWFDAPARVANTLTRIAMNRKIADFTFSDAGIKTMKMLADPNFSAINLAARAVRAPGNTITPEGYGYLSAIYGGENVNRYLSAERDLLTTVKNLVETGKQVDKDAFNIITGLTIDSTGQQQ